MDGRMDGRISSKVANVQIYIKHMQQKHIQGHYVMGASHFETEYGRNIGSLMKIDITLKSGISEVNYIQLWELTGYFHNCCWATRKNICNLKDI